MKKISLSIIAIAFAINFSYAQTFNPTWDINTAGSVNSLVGGYTFAYASSGSPWNGALMSFGGFNNSYDCQISTDYGPNGGKHLSFRTRNGDASVWNSWYEIWNSANLNNSTTDFTAKNIYANGNVGIGTTSPQRNLDLSNAGQLTFGDDVVTNSTNGLYWHAGSDYGIYRTAGAWTAGAYQQLRIQFDTGIQLGAGIGNNAGYDKSYVEIVSGKGLMVSSGNVGIGTTDTKGYNLAVNGSAIATSMTVKLYSSWPDYVFKPGYHLPSLTEVKTYIDRNHHLPDMPSEQEVAKDGINLGEMNKLLTKKVEELTLYLVQQQEENFRIRRLQEQQHIIEQTQIKELKAQLNKINSLLNKK